MFGQYRNSGVRRIDSYADALTRFNDTTPIRGRTDPSKPQVPLGNRNKIDHYSIRKCPFTQDIECVLYRTPVVTFRPNGEVVIKSDGWGTISTAYFIGEVLGMSAYIYDHNLCVGFVNADHTYSNYRIPNKGELVFKKEGRWQYVSGAPETYTHKVNRKVINKLRKQYADFKKYAIAMIKLKEGVFSREEYALAFNDEFPTCINNAGWRYQDMAKMSFSVLADMTNQTDDKFQHYYRALLIFARSYGTSYYNPCTSVKAFEYGFNQFTLGVHRDEALTAEPVPLGKVQKDAYGTYFRKGWAAYHAIKPEGFVLGTEPQQSCS
jgi:hypothetical protein